jgi:hypothetical protein
MEMLRALLPPSLMLLLWARTAAPMCDNPFAGCTVHFNSSDLPAEPEPRNKTVPPPPADDTGMFDDGADALIAGVSTFPWRCNDTGMIWTRCRGPGIPLCEVELFFPESPSPSSTTNRNRRRGLLQAGGDNDDDGGGSSLSPSSSAFRSADDFVDTCRVRVAFAPVVEGWCRNAICDTSCAGAITTKRRVVDFYAYIAENADDCPDGYATIAEQIALLWFLAAVTMCPSCCLGCFRFWQLSIRSRLYWRSYWVGCGAFQSLVFKWPIGRVFFSALGGGIAVGLLSFRKLDETTVKNNGVYPSEEESLIGVDVFASWCFTASSYLWIVLLTSVPLAYGHKAMSIPLRKRKRASPRNKSGGDLSDDVIHLEDPDAAASPKLEDEDSALKDDDILKRLGMRSRFKHKRWIVTHLTRNYDKQELRKNDAILDVRSPMKPSDRFTCAVTLQKSTWKVLSVLYLVTLGAAALPSINAMLFGAPTELFMSFGVRVQHGTYGLVLLMWYTRFKASVPHAKRVLGANVIRPPGEKGKPTNGSKIAMQRWRDRVTEARSRLNPVMKRFAFIEAWTSRIILGVAAVEILIAVFESLHKHLPIFEPLRWVATGPFLFILVWLLPPFPRRTGVSAYKTKTLVELMQPGGKLFRHIGPSDGPGTNPQDGSGGFGGVGRSRYVVPVLLTADMSDTDTREAANARLRSAHQALVGDALSVDERDVRGLLRRFDEVAGVAGVLNQHGFLQACNALPENFKLLSRLYSTLPQQSSQPHSSVRGVAFAAFARAIYAVCIADRGGMSKIVFDMYDADRGGDLDREELRMLLSEVNDVAVDDEAGAGGGGVSEEQIDVFDADGSGTTDREEFTAAARAFPALLRPAYKLQRVLREGTLSIRRWSQIAERSGGSDVQAVAAVSGRLLDVEELEIIDIT